MNVHIYTVAECPASARTKELLDRDHIPYMEEELDPVREHFKSLGLTESPVVTAPNLCWSGFKPSMISEL